MGKLFEMLSKQIPLFVKSKIFEKNKDHVYLWICMLSSCQSYHHKSLTFTDFTVTNVFSSANCFSIRKQRIQ